MISEKKDRDDGSSSCSNTIDRREAGLAIAQDRPQRKGGGLKRDE